MPFEITKQFRFEAAHRLPGHTGKCRFLHGHSYKAFVTVTSDEVLDEMDMVMDFQDMTLLKNWIDTRFDHNTLLWHSDVELGNFLRAEMPDKIPYICQKLPTAEHIANIICDMASNLLDDRQRGIRVTRVTVFETETCCATYTRS